MWRILDLRTGEYFKIFTLKYPNEWKFWDLCNWFEQTMLVRVYSYSLANYSFNLPVSDVNMRQLLIADISDIVYNDNSCTNTIVFYLSECLSEKYLEDTSKKRVLLQCHKAFSDSMRHFYEAVEVDKNGQMLASEDL